MVVLVTTNDRQIIEPFFRRNASTLIFVEFCFRRSDLKEGLVVHRRCITTRGDWLCEPAHLNQSHLRLVNLNGPFLILESIVFIQVLWGFYLQDWIALIKNHLILPRSRLGMHLEKRRVQSVHLHDRFGQLSLLDLTLLIVAVGGPTDSADWLAQSFCFAEYALLLGYEVGRRLQIFRQRDVQSLVQSSLRRYTLFWRVKLSPRWPNYFWSIKSTQGQFSLQSYRDFFFYYQSFDTRMFFYDWGMTRCVLDCEIFADFRQQKWAIFYGYFLLRSFSHGGCFINGLLPVTFFYDVVFKLGDRRIISFDLFQLVLNIRANHWKVVFFDNSN